MRMSGAFVMSFNAWEKGLRSRRRIAGCLTFQGPLFIHHVFCRVAAMVEKSRNISLFLSGSRRYPTVVYVITK